MKYIKKILLITIMSFIPFIVNAEGVSNVDFKVEEVYINANIDIMGSVHITEAIIVNGSLNGFERTINYKNPKLQDYEVGNIDFSNSAIYNARALSLSKVSAYKIDKNNIGWNDSVFPSLIEEFEETENANKGDTKVYTTEESDYGASIRVYNPNSSGYMVYYFEYYLDQAVVIHNDIAELYWQFIPEDFDYIKNVHIQLLLPGSCNTDTFRFWAHGPLTGSIAPILGDESDGIQLYRGVIADVSDVDGTGVDIRVTFDRGFMSMVEKYLDNSEQDALEKIIEVETGRADSANRQRTISKTILYGIYALSGAYLIGLIILWIYMYKKYDKEYKVNFDAKYYREFTGDYGVEVIDYLLTKNITSNAMSASIMSLIYRKNIEIIEDPKDKKNPTLKLISEKGLSEAEQVIIELLFKTISNTDTVTMKQIEKYSSSYKTAEKFMKKYNTWVERVKEAGEKEEFFEDNTSKKAAAALYLLIGIFIIVLMFIFNMVMPVLVCLIAISGISFFIYVMSFKKWTKKGREHYLKWNAFKNFLNDFGSFKEKELPEIKLWEKYLVYATIFGLAKTVQKTMKIKLTELGYDVNNMRYGRLYYRDYYIGNTIHNSIHKSYTNSLSTISSATAHSSMSSGSGFGGGFSSGGGFGGGGGGGHGF